MSIEELKNCIENKIIPSDFMIFIKTEDNFLIEQYISAICDINNLTKNKINSLAELQSTLSLIMDTTAQLNILEVDNFTEYFLDYSDFKNTIAICNTVDKTIKEKVSKYIVEFPKLLPWQIKDYMKLLNTNLSQDDIDWLYAACNGSIYRIINELDKLTFFDESDQKVILASLRYDLNSDLIAVKTTQKNGNYAAVDTFKLVDAIFNKDYEALSSLLPHLSELNLSPYAIISLILTKAKQVLLINFQNGVSAEDLGMSDSQYKFYKHAYSRYSQQHLQYLIKTFSELDYKTKSGLLDTSNKNILNYLILKAVSK